MADRLFTLGLGDRSIEVPLDGAKIIHIIEGRQAAAIADVPAAVREALRKPVGSEPLAGVVRPGDRVAVVVSDVTRAWTRFDRFLPIVLDELNAAGVADEDIAIIIALGAHRPHTPEEDVLVCGREVCRRVRIVQHDAFDSGALTPIGVTSRGVSACINKCVAEADKVILTGGIAYHLMAGFGGGRKAIMPGVSGYESIQANHRFCLHPLAGQGLNPNCVSGKLAGNEMQEDMTEIAALAAPDFLLNAVFTPEGEFARFVGGHWHEAWLAGCRAVEDIYGIPVSARADLVVASAGGFPKDINLYQGSKTIDNAYMAVKPGGVIIAFLEARDIMEPADFSHWFEYADAREFETALRADFTVPGYIAFKLADIARKVTLIVVTRPENTDFVRKIGMIPATDFPTAMAIAGGKLGQDYTITVMPHGANTVPILPGQE